MKPEDIKLFADSVVNGCKVYVASVEKRLNDGLADLAKRLEALPAPKDGVDGKTPGPDDILAAVEAVSAKQFGAFEFKAQQVIDALQKAKDDAEFAALAANEALERIALRLAEVKDGAKGDDGKDADPGAVADLLWPRVKEMIDAIPRPEDGANGADADPEVVRAMVAEAVAALPPAPKGDKGEQGEPVDVQRLIDLVQNAVHEHFAECAPALKGEKGDAGPAIAIEEVQALVDQAVAALPPAQKGDKGDAGADADMTTILARVDELVKAIPAPANGRDADPEVVLAMVKAAVAEIPKPENGVDGIDGQRGEPGRDAIQIDVLPAIDVQRVYPRGTYATHKGGLWRTFKTSVPGDSMEGWECAVEGVAGVEIKHASDDLRTFTVSVERSSGARTASEIRLPVVVYRGVFVDGKAYQTGDSVTWARSTWTCLRDTKAKPEPGSPDWQLSLKQAAAGASAYDIAKKAGFVGDENQWLASLRGPKGEDGRNGIDFNRLGPNGGL